MRISSFQTGAARCSTCSTERSPAASRRAIFWRHSPETSAYGRTFWGAAAERDRLQARRSRVRIRWDRAAVPFCQHQKSWMIDAGLPGAGPGTRRRGRAARPGDPGRSRLCGAAEPERRALFDGVEALGRHPGFRLYRSIADTNGGGWQGEAFTLEPRKYAVA